MNTYNLNGYIINIHQIVYMNTIDLIIVFSNGDYFDNVSLEDIINIQNKLNQTF